MIYFLLAVFIIPFTGILLYYTIEEFWDDIVNWIKSFINYLTQLVIAIIGIIIVLVVSGWLLGSCPSPGPDSSVYDYDPGLRYKRY